MEAAASPDSPESMIVDCYKGLEIHVRVRHFGDDAWRCTIRIYNAPHRLLQSVAATLRERDHVATRQAAMAHAFLEAMSMCDQMLDRPLAT